MMIKKKQAVGIVSIALVFLIAGTSIASGSSPWVIVREAILGLKTITDSLTASLTDLEGRVAAIEGETKHVKTIRFAEPMETMLEVPVNTPLEWTEWKNASAVFTWTPMNTSDNAVVSVYWWFEYKTNITIPFGTPEHYITGGLNASFDDAYGFAEHHEMTGQYAFDVYYKHSGVISFTHAKPKTDCSEYKFWFQVQGFAYSIPFKAYVKNLSAIITVVDGLPASN